MERLLTEWPAGGCFFPRFSRVDDFKLPPWYVFQTMSTRSTVFNYDMIYGLKISRAYCSNVITPTALSIWTTAAPSKMTALFSCRDSETKGASVSKQVSNSDLVENRNCPGSDKDGGKAWFSCLTSRKHAYIILTPVKPHFYIVKLGFTGVYIIFLFLLKNIDRGYSLEKLGFTGVHITFLISAQNIDCGYSLELPHWGGSNKYPQSMFWAEIWKNSGVFIWKFSVFGGEIFFIFE